MPFQKSRFTHAAGIAIALSLFFASLNTAYAQEHMTWQFSEFNDPDNKGRMTARLALGVPETDNVQLNGICDASNSTSVNFSVLQMAAFTGKLKDGDQVKVRFSGGGFEHTLEGEVYGKQIEEGISGILIRPSHNDPIWQAMMDNDALDYMVPGYRASPLNLEGGTQQVGDFIKACRSYAENFASNANQDKKTKTADTSGSLSEKEAFKNTKDLGTIDAWEAFLKRFPEGFRADLAHAYIAKLKNGSDAPDTTSSQPLDTLDLGPGTSPWQNRKFPLDQGKVVVFAASAQATGLELAMFCTPNKQLAAVIRQYPAGVYPNFKQRIKQGLATVRANNNGSKTTYVPVRFSNGTEYSAKAFLKSSANELILSGTGQGFPANGEVVQNLMSEKTVTFDVAPFSGTFQLTNSRTAICEVLNRCGANVSGCTKTTVKTKTKSTKSAKKPKYKKKKKRGCGRGKVWLEGNCVARGDVAAACGPGYKRSGSKCVSRYKDPPQPKCPHGLAWNAQEGCHEDD